jgi:exodeoxyribonuclease X
LRDLNAASLGELLAWSGEPGLLPRVPAGPDRGKTWDRLTDEALQEFARNRDADVCFTAQTERRCRAGDSAQTTDEPAQRSLL